MNELLAEYLGIMTGDGCLSYSFPKSQTGAKYYTYICGHSEEDIEFLKLVKLMINQLFNKEINIGFKKGENTAFIKFSDKKIFYETSKYIPIGKKYNLIKINNDILNSNNLFKAFIRGYFDTDGTIIYKNKYPRLEIKSKSKKLLEQSFNKLKELGFYGSISKSKESYRLELPGHKNLKKWLININFKNKKHLNRVKI